jgi:preprotein translocase subunit SecG
MSSFWINALIDLLLVVYVADCAFMGLIIMMQRSKQEGLGAAFGGGFTESIWGAQTSQVLVKATVYAAALFFICSISLARLYAMRESSTLSQTSAVQQALERMAAPAAVSTNAAPANATPAPAASSTNTPLPVAPAAPATPASH